MNYRVFALMGLLALGAGAIVQAQDYDDIYYDASKTSKVTTKAETPVKTVSVYGEVPERYKVAVRDNYRVERDEDEYNRRGVYELNYEVDINGDTIWFNGDSIYDDDAFANTRRIERFYNPDIVILSDDDDLVELYYSESPTVNLVIGSDWGYGYNWGYSSYFPWYSHRAYYPWYSGWYDPWYYSWYSPWYHHSYWYGPRLWGWGYWGVRPWSNLGWGWGWGWSGHNWAHNYHWDYGRPSGHSGYSNHGWRDRGGRVGLAGNRNGRGRVDAVGTSRNGISARGADGNRGTSVGGNRGGRATTRGGGNMGTRGNSGVSTRGSGVSRQPSYSGGSRSSSGSGRSYSGGSSHSSGGRSSGGSYSGGSRSYSGGSSSHSSGGSYSGGGSRGSSGGGGGSHGGSSGGGGRRR